MIQPPPNSPAEATKPPQPPIEKKATSATTSTTAANPSATKPSATKSPLPSTPKPKAKGGFLRRLMWWFIFICIIGGGSGYYAYQQPTLKPHVQKIIDFVAAQIRAYDSKSNTAPDKTDNLTKSKPQKTQIQEESPTYTESPTYAIPKATAATQSVNQNLPADKIVTDKIVALEKQLIDLQNTIARLQIANGDTNNRLAKLSVERAVPTELQLQLIDLKLRQTGNTNAAADALRVLQTAPDINLQWLAAEIARLQNTVAKNKIAAVLQTLLRDNSPAATATVSSVSINPVADFFTSIFNIRRAEKHDNQLLQTTQRMELLFLSGQRTAYLNILESLAANPPAERNRALQIQILKKYGAPTYSLNLDKRQ